MPSIFCGGARIGDSRFDAINVTFPFARLEVGDRQCIIKIKFLMISKIISLKKDDIQKVEIYSGFFSSEIKFTHSDPLVPKYIVFWTFSSKKVYDSLLLAGYQS